MTFFAAVRVRRGFMNANASSVAVSRHELLQLCLCSDPIRLQHET